MKTKYLLILALVCFFACSKESNIENAPQVNVEYGIITKLSKVNDNLRQNYSQTRGNGRENAEVSRADAEAELAAMQHMVTITIQDLSQRGCTYEQIYTYVYSAEFREILSKYSRTAAASASKKAAARINKGGCSIIDWETPTTATTFQDGFNYYKSVEALMPNDSLEIADEDTISTILLPSGSRWIIASGIEHNGIIRKSLVQRPIKPIRRSIVEPHDPSDPESPVETIFSDLNFIDSFQDFGDMVDEWLDSLSTGTLSLLDYVFPVNNIEKQVGELFLNALLYCNSQSDVITLANSYIDIIQYSSELTSGEKDELYSCFVVAVYSYGLWSELFDEEELDPNPDDNPGQE